MQMSQIKKTISLRIMEMKFTSKALSVFMRGPAIQYDFRARKGVIFPPMVR